MLEKPDLPDEQLLACVREQYGLRAASIAFLPVGADVNASAYRLSTTDETVYFLKLRRGVFDDVTVRVPGFLHAQGIRPIIAPLATRSGELWAKLDGFTLILYPFVEGHNAFDMPLSDCQRVEFGAALRAIHDVSLPPTLLNRLPRENYSPRWRDMVRTFQEWVEHSTWADPAAAGLAALLKEKRALVTQMVEQAERLGEILRAREPHFVLCHGDLHAWNILLSTDGALYIVDWDTPMLALKERDLMYIGAGFGGIWQTAQEEEPFYRGYGTVAVDPIALAYYRYERMAWDIAVYCEQLLLTDAGGADRPEMLRQLASSFEPGEVIDIAFRSEAFLPPELRFNNTRLIDPGT